MSAILKVLDHWCFENGPLTEAARKEYAELQERLRADREALAMADQALVAALEIDKQPGVRDFPWNQVTYALALIAARMEAHDA